MKSFVYEEKVILMGIDDEGDPGLLTISINNVIALMKKINQIVKIPNGYSVATHMLGIVRYMILRKGMHRFLFPEFFTMHVQFCRDGKDLAFNKNAWQMLYQMITFNEGTLEYLMERGLLQHYAEAVTAIAGDVVIQNSLHYFARLFNMYDHAKNKFVQLSHSSRASLKAQMKTNPTLIRLNRSTALFCKFYIDRRMFIKFHMIYKRLHVSECYRGIIWIKLAELYTVLRTSSSCKNLRRNLLNNVEYAKGYQVMAQLVESKVCYDVEPSPRVTPRTRSKPKPISASMISAATKGRTGSSSPEHLNPTSLAKTSKADQAKRVLSRFAKGKKSRRIPNRFKRKKEDKTK
eukprot:TRINITY_DN7620_c0_g1_i1.p1 TRINITY_DN7620_c0_g1~~TRINITY_DN7620_c0_g1_i1.p1  ORF type:complete len:348 (+),score=53.64 TRINITY_DN7620_c0_g1_i1:3-1046(+)